MLKWDKKLQKINIKNNYDFEKVEKSNNSENLREMISTQKKYKTNLILSFGNKKAESLIENQNKI